MSISGINNNIQRIEREIQALHENIARESRYEADKLQRISQNHSSINQYSSESTIRSKSQENSRLNREVSECKRKIADYQGQMARKNQEMSRQRLDLSREEAQERKKERDGYERRIKDMQSAQSSLSSRLTEVALASQQTPEIRQVDLEEDTEYDVFVSHASEDKDFVKPLVDEMTQAGIKVWYDETAIKWGDSLRRSIDKGLSKSKFGIVVLSKSFFAKGWPQYELDGLVSREIEGNKVILPIWHNISKDEVRSYSPTLADKLAMNTASLSAAEIAAELKSVLN